MDKKQPSRAMGLLGYVRNHLYRVVLPAAVVILMVMAIVISVTKLYNGPRTDNPQNCGYDTGYTCQTGDVMTNITFKCEPEEQNQWYRTDQSLAIDPKNPDIMYISVEWKGVYKTIDGGKTWEPKSKGIRAYARDDDITKPCHSEYPVIRIDPHDSDHLVITVSGGGGGYIDATTPNSQTGGVYQSFDGGENWQLMINNHMNRYVNDIAIDPVREGTIYYTTSSIPASWIGADQNERFVSVGLVYKTTDYGKTWEELPSGTGDNSNARYVFINPEDTNELIVPTWSALRLSSDGTGTGESTGKDTSAAEQLGVLRSTDDGRTWAQAFDSFQDYPFLYTYVAPQNYRRMYSVITEKSKEETVFGLVTTDGRTLQKTKYVDLVAYDPFDPSANHMIGFTTVIIGPNSENFNLWESNDGGFNWQRYGTLPAEFDDFNSPHRPTRLAWHPTDRNVMFMTGGGGHVWKSTNMGRAWTKLIDYRDLHE